jgi:hypothetical protein
MTDAIVERCSPAGAVYVSFGEDTPPVLCDQLVVSSAEPALLGSGDRVLVWRSVHGRTPPVILGRIGPSHAPAAEPELVPDELTLEARESLTLRVGEGSITLRGDGRILIKGRDLVSHAKRLNRIKGGAVSIN